MYNGETRSACMWFMIRLFCNVFLSKGLWQRQAKGLASVLSSIYSALFSHLPCPTLLPILLLWSIIFVFQSIFSTYLKLSDTTQPTKTCIQSYMIPAIVLFLCSTILNATIIQYLQSLILTEKGIYTLVLNRVWDLSPYQFVFSHVVSILILWFKQGRIQNWGKIQLVAGRAAKIIQREVQAGIVDILFTKME